MPRTYKRKPGARRYQSYSPLILKEAVDKVRSGIMGIREASRTYDIPVGTMVNKLKHKHTLPVGGQVIFTEEEEETFVAYISKVGEWGFPFDGLDVQMLVKSYLQRTGRTIRQFKNGVIPGKEWVRSFLRRHKNKIVKRMCQNITTQRASVTPQITTEYFQNLRTTLLQTIDEVEVPVPPENIINYDETHMADDPGQKKCFFKAGVKYPERVRNSAKSGVSVMFAGTATGYILPIYVVYKADHLWTTWVQGGPPHTRYNRSHSGWFDSTIFTDWFMNTVVPYAKKCTGKVIVFGDNLTSHFTPEVLEYCAKNNIAFICMPSNGTHLFQPLDVGFYGPAKKRWRQVLDKWKMGKKKTSQNVTKDVFPHLLQQLMDVLCESSETGAYTSKNLVAGFEKSGVHPLNAQKVIDRLPSSTPNSNVIQAAVSSTVIDMLTDMRYGNSQSGAKPRGRRSKVQVPPGRSIGLEDLNGPSTSAGNEEAHDDSSDNSSDDSSVEDGICNDDASSVQEETSSDRSSEEMPEPVDIREEDFVIVRVLSKSGTHRFYVAKVIYITRTSELADSNVAELEVRFLRNKKTTGSTGDNIVRFVWPVVEDQWSVNISDVIKRLPAPSNDRRGYGFSTMDLDQYKLE